MHKISRRFVSLLLWVLFMLSGFSPVQAQVNSQYFHAESFHVEDGLGHNVVGDLQSDKNGFLWVSTLGHLQLFDGMHFIDMNHLLREEPVYTSFNFVYTDEIFLITRSTLYHLNTDNYAAREIPLLVLPHDSSSLQHFRFLYENADYLFVWNRENTVFKINKKLLKIEDTFTLEIQPHEYNLFNGINRRAISPDKIEYVGVDFKLYSLDLLTGEVSELMQLTNFADIAKISTDSLVTVDATHLNLYTAGKVISIHKPVPGISIVFDQLMIADDHTLFVGTSNGIYEFDLVSMTFTNRLRETGDDQLAEVTVRMMEKDNRGNYFISTFNDGLIMLHPRNAGFDYIGLKERKKNFAKSVLVSDKHNMVLMGTLNDGLFLFDTLGQFIEEINLPGDSVKGIRALTKISDSDVIIMGYEAYHMKMSKDNYQVTQLKGFDRKWISYYNHALELPEKNKSLVSMHYGLLELMPGDPIGFSFSQLHALDKAFAFSAYNDGFVSAGSGHVKVFDASLKKPLRTWQLSDYGYIRCAIQRGPAEILIGTDLGLYQIDLSVDDLHPVRIYDKLVYAILPGDQDKEFWFSTDQGLFELKPDGSLTNYSREIGLQENEFNTGSAYKSESGKLYFGGINGITSFYPNDVTENPDSIQCYVSSFSVNNEVIARYLSAAVNVSYTLQPKENNIGIDLLARGDKSPLNYNYQYMIKGLTKGWVDMSRNSQLNIHLKSGIYTFYFHIADGFNPDAKPSGAFMIHILKPLYYRWWFLSAIGLFLLGIALYVINMNRKKELMKIRYENKLMQRLQNERMRISRELHDNIGAQMATVKRHINFLIGNSNAMDQHQVIDKMKDLEGISSQINQELRDTIWATQHEHISVFNFIARLKNYIFQTLGPESPIRVQYVESCDKEVILGPFLALNLHRICQEAINNAVKHSGATEIKVCFEGNGEHFKVTVIDNGKGFDMQEIHEGYGLKNIKHRAEMIGAAINFTSHQGTGTMLEVNIPKLETSNNSLDL